VSRRHVVGGLYGTVWGACAAAVFVAMRSELLPAPFEVALPFAIGLVFAYFPFVTAMGLEALLVRPSPSLAEIVGLTIACGTALGFVVSRIGR